MSQDGITVKIHVVAPESAPGDSCATCERWLRVKTWPTGKCGKRGWRTDENDWCSAFTPKGVRS